MVLVLPHKIEHLHFPTFGSTPFDGDVTIRNPTLRANPRVVFVVTIRKGPTVNDTGSFIVVKTILSRDGF